MARAKKEREDSDCGEKKLPRKSAAFAAHLKKIRDAKAQSDCVASLAPMETPRAVMSVMWEMLFDYLCAAGALEVSDMNTLAGVVQKLASARVQVANAAAKEGGEFSGFDGDESFSLTEDALLKIEEQLKLI